MRKGRLSRPAVHRCLLVAALLVSLRIPAQAAGTDSERDAYWIVASPDDVLVRQVSGDVPLITHPFNPLRRSDEVMCRGKQSPATPAVHAKKSPAPVTCEIDYFEHSDAQKKPLLRIPVGRWIALARANLPEPAVFLPPAPDPRQMRPLGARKSSGCTGHLPVRAPTCDEIVDVTNFVVRWEDIPGAEHLLILLASEFSDKAPFRKDQVMVSDHSYSSQDLTNFLIETQQNGSPTDLMLRVSVSQKNFATRHLSLPAREAEAKFRVRLDEIEKESSQLVRSLEELLAYKEFGFRSRAAAKAVELMKLAAPLDYVNDFVRVGLCESEDYADEKEDLRARMHLSGGGDLCAADAK